MMKIGIVGYGKLGRYLAAGIGSLPDHELAFVWNRNFDAIGSEIPTSQKLRQLGNFAAYKPDLIVEVAHPAITQEWGERFLRCCNYMAGSPTAFATKEIEDVMRKEAKHPTGNGLYIPRGALPGLEEVLRMRNAGKLADASITMRKHPSSLKVKGGIDKDGIVYEGPLRKLCSLAPNNVNTMAVLALSSELGFDKVHATLEADSTLHHHITEVCLYGPETGGARYSLELIRNSPAGAGAVTSTATLDSFLGSMLRSRGRGDGVHFC